MELDIQQEWLNTNPNVEYYDNIQYSSNENEENGIRNLSECYISIQSEENILLDELLMNNEATKFCTYVSPAFSHIPLIKDCMWSETAIAQNITDSSSNFSNKLIQSPSSSPEITNEILNGKLSFGSGENASKMFGKKS